MTALEQQQSNEQNFLQRIYRKGKKVKSKRTAKCALSAFGRFCQDEFSRSKDDIISTCRNGKLDPYKVLDAFSLYLQNDNDNASTVSIYVTYARKYMVYSDVDINPYRFREKVELPKIIRNKDPPLNTDIAIKILSAMPIRIRLLCMQVMTSLRRPNELLHLKFSNYNFLKTPTMITLPAEITKNSIPGTTFITEEVTNSLLFYKQQCGYSMNDYVFGKLAEAPDAEEQCASIFKYHMERKLPDLAQKTVSLKVNRLLYHIYSFKDLGYTIIDMKLGKNFADGMKGDKNSEYHNMPDDQKMQFYLEIEPYLTLFNADQVRRDVEAMHQTRMKILQEQGAEIEVIKQEVKNINKVLDSEQLKALLDKLNAMQGKNLL